MFLLCHHCWLLLLPASKSWNACSQPFSLLSRSLGDLIQSQSLNISHMWTSPKSMSPFSLRPTHSTPKFGRGIGILTLTCSKSNSWYSPHFYSFTSVSRFSKQQCDSVSEIPNFGVILDSSYAFPSSNPTAISVASTLKMYSRSGYSLLLHHYDHPCFSRPFQESCNKQVSLPSFLPSLNPFSIQQSVVL